MANRCYLFSTDLVPAHENAGRLRAIAGLSESRYSLPLFYRVLIAGTPRVCLSNIWQFRTEPGGLPQPIAIAAPYAPGLENLRYFRAALKHPAIRPMLDEALAFLQRPENVKPYFLLEPAEYFALFDEGDEPQGKLPTKVAALCEAHQGDPRESLTVIAERLNALPADDAEAAAREGREVLGVCVWSNVLYEDPSPNGA